MPNSQKVDPQTGADEDNAGEVKFSPARLLTIVSIIVTLGGAGLYVDDRYAKAAEVATRFAEITSNRIAMESRIKTSVNQQIIVVRIRQLEDAVFEFEFKMKSEPKGLTALDSAKYQRNLRELQELKQQIGTQ
jgi:hypothetical protein